MEGIIRIIQRYVIITIMIILFLFIINFVLLGTLIFSDEINKTPKPDKIMEKMVDDLVKHNGDYFLQSQSEKFLKDNDVWAMLIDHDGKVIWEYDLPNDIALSYNLVEVAKFSRYYLNEYPVYTWEQRDGLLVIGYPKASLWKYQIQFWSEGAQTIPLRIVILFVVNIVIAILISIIVSASLIKDIRPLIRGIHDLSREKEVNLKTKGIFKDLANSINITSSKIIKNKKALEDRDEARSNWIKGISHDIRTPLSIILGYASEMEDSNELSIEFKKQAAIIRRHTENIRELVKNLNLVSMLEYEMQPLNLKLLQPSAIIREVAANFLNGGLDQKYKIELQISNEKVFITGDEKLLIRAITNVIQNSVSHNPQGCNIILEMKVSKDCSVIYFIIIDDGIGINEEIISILTKLPYTTKSIDGVQHNHGLGLPMVYRIIKAHGGEFSIENNLSQKGVRVTMKIPLSKLV